MQLMKILLLYAKQHYHTLKYEPLYALLIKALSHEYIVTYGLHDLIPLYDKLYNDGIYRDIKNNNTYAPVLPKEWIADKIKAYQNKCEHEELQKISKRKPYSFEIGEIVGVRDKENHWWMSRVLDTYSYGEHNVYYVEFLGWGEKFNEFITDVGYRIEPYKPKKHKYYRPSWKSNKYNNMSKKCNSSKKPNDTANSTSVLFNNKNINIGIVNKINVPNKINGPKKVSIAKNQVVEQDHDRRIHGDQINDDQDHGDHTYNYQINDDHTHDDESINDEPINDEPIDNIQVFDESTCDTHDFEDKESLYDE